MAEPDLGGIGIHSSEGSGAGGDSMAGVFRAASSVKIDYEDVKGLVKQMTDLATAVSAVKRALDSLDEGKTKEALKNLSASLSGGGGVGSGANTAVRGNGGNATFGGLSPGMVVAGAGLSAVAAMAGQYSARKQDDLMSDVTSMRVALGSGVPSFGLKQASAMVSSQLGPASLSRGDMNQAAQSIFGRYGTPGSTTNQNALKMTRALSMVTMQGATFGADLMNAANDPSVLHQISIWSGRQVGPFQSSTDLTNTLTRMSFGTANPSENLLSHWGPGQKGYTSMMTLTGNNAALGQAIVDEKRAEERYRANGGKKPWNDDTISGMSDEMQKKIFGEKSFYVSQRKYEAGKAVIGEEGLNLARSGLVGSNEFLISIQNNTKTINETLTHYLAPISNALGGMSGKFDALSRVLVPLSLLSRGGGKGPASLLSKVLGAGGGDASIAEQLGAAAATEGGLGAGMSLAVGGGIVAAGTAAAYGAQALVHHFLGKPKKKKDIDGGNIARWTVEGGAIGSVIPGIGTAAGAVTGLVGGALKEGLDWLGGGDPVGVGDAMGSDQSRGAAGGPHMSLTDATKLLLSRNRGGSSSAVTNMTPDLRVKLGRLFAMNPALSLSSGWRSIEQQKKLYALYKAGKGNLAAKPGTSNHEYGLAADIGPKSQYGWLAANARGVGLVRPMAAEPWHWEPPGAKSQRGGAGGAPAAADGGLPGSAGGGIAGTGIPVAAAFQMLMGGAGSDGFGMAPELSGIAIQSLGGGGGAAVGAARGSGVGAGAWDGKPGSLSINAAARLAAAAGIPHSMVPTAVAIAMAESSLNPNKHNTRGKDDSYGLWQINMTNAAGGPSRRQKYHLSADSQLLNPNKNAEAMADISGHGHNWGPWSTYPNLYKKYMGSVNEALSSGVGDPVAQAPTMHFGSTPTVSMHGGNKATTIVNIKVMQASYEEAVRLGHIIKKIVDGDLSAVDAARTGS